MFLSFTDTNMTWFEEMMQAGAGVDYASMGMDPAMAALFAGFVGGGLVVVALIVLMVIAWCFVFKKMGNRWYEALISGHNLFVLITNAGKPGWWIFAPLVMLVPIPVVAQLVGGILSLLVWIAVNLWLAKKFGKGTWFGVGLILLPFIFYPILARGKAKYKK